MGSLWITTGRAMFTPHFIQIMEQSNPDWKEFMATVPQASLGSLSLHITLASFELAEIIHIPTVQIPDISILAGGEQAVQIVRRQND